MMIGGISSAFDSPNGAYIYELCSLLGIYHPDDDTHEKIVDQIEEIYGPIVDKTIVEVACGAFAPISAKIAERTKGKVKVYAIDPKLIIGQEFGIIPIKEELQNQNQIPDDAIVVSKDPCTATFNLGRFVTIKNVQLYIMLCHCNDRMMNDSIFRIYLEDRLSEQEVHQTALHDSLYGVDKPVVYTIKK